MKTLCEVKLRYEQAGVVAGVAVGAKQSQTHLIHIDFLGCRLHLELSLSSCTLSTHQQTGHVRSKIHLKSV